jgi:enediyne biosynthesis protein E4
LFVLKNLLKYPSTITLLCIFSAIYLGCKNDEGKPLTLFEKISSARSGINSTNALTFNNQFNVYTYRNFYNGGGVALGDINNDGLLDIYFSFNMEENRLYLNRGSFQFEDITEKAGVAGKGAWSTGVSMADVNGDGLLDIYVCNSGDVKGDNKQNELFINQGDLTFVESALEYGVDDRGYSTHAAFFDYDNDGDLDLYILNNSFQAIGSFNLRKNERGKRDNKGGHKLLRNDNSHFVDVSEQAGIYGSVIAFGLGVTVGDINKDGWQDIYVSNDFFERDYLYINSKNGTFKECLPNEMKSISGASMGADLADINNDTYADIFVTEMLPEKNDRIKTVTTFENWDRYQYNVANGYYHQFTRNMLQLNNGDDTFSEIGRLCKVEATDWSWGALIFDMDNDGYKDIFVANGIVKDLTNQDYLQFASSEEIVRSVTSGKDVDYKKLIDAIPSNKMSNYAFHNEGNFGFNNMASSWGLGEPSFSNGSAYGDLDNDGDLDLVINNLTLEPSLFRNNTNSISKNTYLKFILHGLEKNTLAFGTKITVFKGHQKFYLEQMPIRGFESSVDTRPNFGLGKLSEVDSVIVEWPDDRITCLRNTKTNQTISLNQLDGKKIEGKSYIGNSIPIFNKENANEIGIDFKHKENDFVDFDRDRLIYHMLSSEGPKISVGDVNGDRLDDFFIGGAKDQPGALYVQLASGQFRSTNQKLFEEDKSSEDTGSTFFDADKDGDLDLYVCSGGSEFSSNSSALIDRLYINTGKGKFNKRDLILPTFNFESTSTVKACDYDKDGDEDLFVGVRLQSLLYGVPVNGYILNNDGTGKFENVTEAIAPNLLKIGMITDASWSDVDGDKDMDLVIVGDWMPIKVFLNEGGKFSEVKSALENSNGWWNTIEPADLDNDGDIDFVVGNHGLNSRFRASVEKPITMYVNDFDQNGTVEQIISCYNGDKSYPMALRHDLIQQLPLFKKKYLKYDNYKDQTITDVFTAEQMKRAISYSISTLSTSILINEGDGTFKVNSLPIEAQFSPMYGISIIDADRDGKLDIIAGGNLYRAKPEVGRYDASYGVFLKGDGKGNFISIPAKESGLFLDGEVRDIVKVRCDNATKIIVSRNNDSPVVLKLK